MTAEPEANRVTIIEDHADFRHLMEDLPGRQPAIDLLAQEPDRSPRPAN